jgi:glycosyltransferase involved in cell wall biosynthesis
MTKEYIRISIVMPSFYQGNYIERSILSVINQNYPNLELIVIDGGSTDNSVEVIKKYEQYITYWVSEPDNGQSHAINEGFKMATGTFLTWLNTDDLLLPGTLKAVNNAFIKHPGCRWIAGNVIWIDKSDTILRLRKGERWNSFFARHGLFSLYGPTSFMHKDMLNDHGVLKEEFHYMMDTELWCRFVNNGEHFIRINHYCWALRLHEEAKMSGHNFEQSTLASKEHPSWKQKEKEYGLISRLYLQNRPASGIKHLFFLYKISHGRILFRPFIDWYYKGKNINEII